MMLHRNRLVFNGKNVSVVALIDLIGDPRQALVAAENGKHVEHAGRGRPSGKCCAQRLCDGAQLKTIFLGESSDPGFRRGGKERGHG